MNSDDFTRLICRVVIDYPGVTGEYGSSDNNHDLLLITVLSRGWACE